MATVGALNIILSANSASFTKGMQQAKAGLASAQAAVKSFSSSLFSMKGAVVAAAGALGVGLSANAFKGWIGSSMQAIDVNAKLSDRLAITTEALVGLQHAANLAGITNEELTAGIEKMLKSLPGGTSTEDAFNAIADQLKAMPSAFDRAKLATEIFGKAGQRLLPLLMEGAEGIKAAQAEAERLGITFSRVDAAKVEAANDAMTRLHAIFTGIAQTIAIEVAPFIEAAATHLTNMAAAGEGMGPKVVAGIEMIVVGIAKATDYVNLLKAAFYGVRAAVLQVVADVTLELAKWAKMLGPKAAKMIGLPSAAELRTSARGLAQAAAEEAAKVNDAMNAFNRGDNAKAAQAFFDDIKKRAEEAAKAKAQAISNLNNSMVDTTVTGMQREEANSPAVRVKTMMEEVAREVGQLTSATTRRTSFFTPGTPNRTEEKQLAEATKQTKQGDAANTYLQQIAGKLGQGSAVALLSL